LFNDLSKSGAYAGVVDSPIKVKLDGEKGIVITTHYRTGSDLRTVNRL